jgi:pyridoxal phosphate enzyme (YggS family)
MISENLNKIRSLLSDDVTLVAVSKTKPNETILEAYETGQKNFGENKVQELVEKSDALPKDIQWHLIGHLQRNKVKYIAPFVSLIHAVDSLRLLKEINKQAEKNNRTIDCLLQFHIADEESKFGLDQSEASELLKSEEFRNMQNIRICGVMGMATFTDDQNQVRLEFKKLNQIFRELKASQFSGSEEFEIISMGMSGDWKIAVEEGSTMIRVGSSIFGVR